MWSSCFHEGMRECCDVLFAATFLCGVERRRGVVLGMERLWPSDAFLSRCCLRFDLVLCCGAWRTGYAADIVCLVVQVGDGSTFDRYTPVAVVGLSSGVAMVALGYVRLFFCCCVVFVFWRLVMGP